MGNSDQGGGGELDFFEALGGEDLKAAVQAYDALLEDEAPIVLSGLQWEATGKVLDFKGYDGGMRLECLNGFLDVYWVADDCLRMVYRKTNAFDALPFSYAVVDQPPRIVKYDLVHDEQSLEMRTTQVRCQVVFDPITITLLTLDGDVLARTQMPGAIAPGGEVRAQWGLQPDEAVYGLGERSHTLNLRGDTYSFWNYDQPDCDPGTDPLYFCVPFFVTANDAGAFGLFFDNSYRGTADVGANDDHVTFAFAGGEVCYYWMVGRDAMQVVRRYAQLTGPAPMPPLWYLGYHQSRFSYAPADEVLSVAKSLRLHNIPADVIHLDIHYMEQFKVFTWDKIAFPDFEGMIERLHELGFKVVVIIDPGIKAEAGYRSYESGVASGVFIQANGQPLEVVVWPGLCHMPDFTQPETRSWWAEQIATLLETGVDGIWNDMNEPAVFSSDGAVTLPMRVSQSKEHHNGTHLELHNVYGMQMARASLDGLEQARPDRRPVNITRAGYAGTQRYASSWTGDVTSNWEHLRVSIPMVLNLGLSGIGLTGPDVGGFRESTDAELFTRWTQAACLMPFFRNHSAIDTIRQEPWVFGDPYTSAVRAAIRLRYALMPYLYSVVAQHHAYGDPVVRPVFFADPKDASLRDVDDQYMLGDALLLAPVVEPGASERAVRLPVGIWYDYWTGDLYDGGQTITLPVALDTIPLFVRGGAVLPVWEVGKNLADVQVETLNMRVYPGKLETALYEDTGEGLGYRSGEYRWIYYSANWATFRFKVQRRIAGRYQPTYTKMHLTVFGFDEEPYDVRVDHQAAPMWSFEDGRLEMVLDDFHHLEITEMIGADDETIPRRRY